MSDLNFTSPLENFQKLISEKYDKFYLLEEIEDELTDLHYENSKEVITVIPEDFIQENQ